MVPESQAPRHDIGDKEARKKLFKGHLNKLKSWDVLVTTYEMVLLEKILLKKVGSRVGFFTTMVTIIVLSRSVGVTS